ncbi:MAG: metal-sulfur cluster assembly factor [Ferruginibacter sp.]
MNVETDNDLKLTIALAALESVIDPEIQLNIVDLGLIYKITFNEQNKVVHCLMTLTTQFCPMGESIKIETEQTLKATFPDVDIIVELIFDPPWNHERISEEGQIFLNS